MGLMVILTVKIKERNDLSMSYFRSDGDYIYSTVPYMEFYIPLYYFKGSNSFAEERGTLLSTFGVFNVGIFKNDKLVEMKTMNVPSVVDLCVYDFEQRSVELPGQDEPVPCKVYKYLEGAKIMPSSMVQKSENVTWFLTLITMGKLPPTIPYCESFDMWLKNLEMNNVKFGVPAVIEELVLSAAYRYNKDPSKKFSLVIGKDPKVSQFDYTMASIRQICQYTSTYTAMTFEDFDTMVTSSLNRVRENRDEVDSPVEKVLKM